MRPIEIPRHHYEPFYNSTDKRIQKVVRTEVERIDASLIGRMNPYFIDSVACVGTDKLVLSLRHPLFDISEEIRYETLNPL